MRAGESITSSPGSTRPRPNPRLSLLMIVASFSLGIWFDLARPLWPRPPLFVLMPAVYALLPLAWLPALVVCALFRILNLRLLVLTGVVLLMGNCFWFVLTAPRTTPELPYLGANGELN